MRVRAKLTIRNATLIEARKKLGLSQKETAKRAKISPDFLYKLEKFSYQKNCLPDDDRIMRLCLVLGVEPEEVLPEALVGRTLQDIFMATEKMSSETLLAVTDCFNSRMLLPSPEDEAEKNEQIALIKQYMKSLSYREQEIIKLLFGLGDDGNEYTLEETARIFRTTRERVRQVEAKAIRKLQVRAEKNMPYRGANEEETQISARGA